MAKLFRNRLVAFLMIFVLLTVIVSGFNLTESFALFTPDDENVPDIGNISYDENNQPYRTGQLIITYRGNSTADEKRSIRATMQLELKVKINSINAEVIKVKNEQAKEVLSNLKKNPKVLFAEYDYLASTDHEPNDIRYPYQVYLHYMNASKAWDYTKGSPNITVAVIDSGILTNNTDLKNINMSGYNVADSNSDFTDSTGHGTAVISVIAGEMDNTFGFAGVAPESSFMVLKVIDEQGFSTYSDLIRALEYATTQEVDVINMSVGGRSDSLSLKMAIDNAYNSGVTIVAAAGNDSTTTVSFPAAYNNVVAVGSVSTSGSIMTFSNTGNGLTVVAGGTAMIATSTDYITSASGTSFSSPYAAGLVALMYAVDDNMTPMKVFDILEATSTDLGSIGYDTIYGYGVINMGDAVEMAANNASTPPSEPEADTIPPVLTLNGDNQMSLEVGSTYNEVGALAIDDVDGNISDDVVISGTVNVSSVGLYSLIYSVADQAGNQSNIEVRTVEVVETTSVLDTTPPVLTLIGDSNISLEIGSPYIEPGAQAIDDVDGDISNDIVISGSVDVSKLGFYYLTYSVSDQAGNQSNIETREVEIFEYVEVEETHIIRDVEILKGTLNKKNNQLTYVISITEPGKLDVDLQYTGKSTPQLSIDGINIKDVSGTYDVSVGDYDMILESDANIKYTVTLTYPEREVPLDVPAGPPDITLFEEQAVYRIYIYLAIALMVVLAMLYVYKRRNPKFMNHK